MGQRLRLKSNFDIDSYLNGSFSGGPLNAAQRTAMERIFHAMKTYGLIVADNGGAMYCQGTMDSRWDTFISAELRNAVFHGVNINNFDMLQRGWDGTGGVRGNLEFTE